MDSVLRPVVHVVRGKKQKSASTQQWLNCGRCWKSIKSMTVNFSSLKQQFLNSFCPGTIDMTAGVLWGSLQPCTFVDLPQDVAWGFAGRTTCRSEGVSVPRHVPKIGNHYLRNRPGKEASPTLVFGFFSLVIGLAGLTYSRIPLEDCWKYSCK